MLLDDWIILSQYNKILSDSFRDFSSSFVISFTLETNSYFNDFSSSSNSRRLFLKDEIISLNISNWEFSIFLISFLIFSFIFLVLSLISFNSGINSLYMIYFYYPKIFYHLYQLYYVLYHAHH